MVMEVKYETMFDAVGTTFGTGGIEVEKMVEFGSGLIVGDIFVGVEPGVTVIIPRYDEVENFIGSVGESEAIVEAWGETNFFVDVAVGCLVVVRARLVFFVVDDDVFVVVSDVVVFRVLLVVPPEFSSMPRFPQHRSVDS